MLTRTSRERPGDDESFFTTNILISTDMLYSIWGTVCVFCQEQALIVQFKLLRPPQWAHAASTLS